MKPISFSWIAAAAIAVILPAGVQAQESTQPRAAGGASATGEVTQQRSTAVGNPGTGAAAAKSQLAKQDEQFLQKAAQGSIMEVRLGELASQKAAAQPVKEFGAMMVKDHGKANQELNELAGRKGVALDTELDSKHQSTVDRFGKLTGEQFDKAYINEMVSAHKKDISEFEKASKSATDPDIKAFAQKTLPALQTHLEHAQGLKKNGGRQQ